MLEDKKYHPIPQPDEITEREREDAMGGYLMMFATMAIGLPLPIINLVAAIIYYYVNKSKGRFVRFHALQSLFSQIPVTLVNAGGIFWLVRILVLDLDFTNYFFGYLVMIGVANILYFIFSLMGAVRARKGRFYYFWLFGAWAYATIYAVRPEEKKGGGVNKPPV